jgi:DNA-binding CsgD family transcriptional regulator
VLQCALELEDYALTVIAPHMQVLGFLVADGAEVTPDDRRALDTFGHIVGLTLETVTGRLRLEHLASELRCMYTSGAALLHEALETPPALVSGPTSTLGLAYPGVEDKLSPAAAIDGLLTSREDDVVRLIVRGKSNREIAAELHLSVATVKWYVARALRKLGAPNRVQAVSRYLELTRGVSDPQKAHG